MLINNKLIHTNRYYNEKAKATIIITHGIAEHSGRFGEVALELQKEGFNVLTYDIRGHGQSQGKRGSIKSYNTFLKDLNELVKFEKAKELKVYLLGHSLGGIITNLYAINYGDIDGTIIVSSPLTYVKGTKLLKYNIHKLIGFKKIKVDFNDPNLSKDAHNPDDPLNLQYFRLSLVGELLVKGVGELIKDLPKYRTPTLALHGLKDVIVPIDNVKEGFELNGSKDKTLLTYEKSKHDLLHDIEKDKVLDNIISWVNDRL